VLRAIELTRNNQRLVLNLAFNYGGRDEIVCAIRDIIAEGIPADEITPEVVSQHLFTAGIPDPDLIVRTSGEMRVSNFLIWQGLILNGISPLPFGLILTARNFTNSG
jgi:undecaprenyl diphosphate synthase